MATNSFVQVPPDSTGKKIFHRQHTIDGAQHQLQVIHIADEVNPQNILSIDENGAELVSFAEGQPAMAGFGSLKVSNHRALGVYESSLDTYDDLFTIVQDNGATSAYSTQQSSHVLSTSGTIGSRVCRTTNRYHYYLPGTSNFSVMTIATGDAGKIGNVRRWGSFDDKDGVFFELYETTLNVVIRSSISGSIVETKVPYAQWDVHTAPFTIQAIELTNINVWWFDYQWLGAGRVRFGIYRDDGSRIVLHTIQNAGKNTLPYMRTGTLPLRTENLDFATTGSVSQLREVCMATYCEGNFDDYTFWRHCGGIVTNTAAPGNTTNMMVAYRAISTVNGEHNSVQAYPETVSIYTDQPIAFTLWQTVNVTSGTNWIPVIASTLERLETGTVDVTNSVPFTTSFAPIGVTNFDISSKFEVNDEGIMCQADGTAEVWAFTARSLSGTPANVTINMTFRELW